MNTYVHIYIYAYLYIWICVYMYICMLYAYTLYILNCIYINTCIRKHIYIYVRIQIYLKTKNWVRNTDSKRLTLTRVDKGMGEEVSTPCEDVVDSTLCPPVMVLEGPVMSTMFPPLMGFTEIVPTQPVHTHITRLTSLPLQGCLCKCKFSFSLCSQRE